jgi:glycosyltransferase involved in cell wall biosynthesis
MKRISIIISVLNGEHCIEDCLQSIVRLDYPGKEIIIIDGGSNDRTLEIIQKYSDQIDYFISEVDQGIYDAWNKAISLSKGDYIAFLGAGDSYLSEGLEALVNLAIRNKDAEFISGKVSVEGIGRRPRIIGRPWKWSLFRRYMCTTHVGALHSRQLFNRYGKFNTRYKIAGDYELLLRAKQNLQSVFLDRATATMLAGGISQRNHQVLHEARKAKLENHAVSRITAYYDFLIASIKLFIRQKFLS